MEYIYVQLNHFALQRKLTQHCKSTMLQLKKIKADCAFGVKRGIQSLEDLGTQCQAASPYRLLF